jgi:hypothetical protein
MVFWKQVLAWPRAAALGIVLAATGLTGCSLETAAPPAKESSDAASVAPSAGETWDVINIGGSRIGYIHTRTRSIEEQGKQLLQIEVDQRMSVNRFGDRSQPGIYLKSIETPGGEVLRFESRQELGPQPELTKGSVAGNQMLMETTTTGKTVKSQIPWSAETKGFFAVEQSLSRRPMKPNETRTLRGLAPLFNQVLRYELTARPKESVAMFEGSLDLLPVDVVTILPDGKKLRSTIWSDERGEPLKNL